MTDWTVVGLIVGAAVAVIGALVIVLLGRPDEHPADRVGRDAPPAAAPMLSRAVVSRGVVNRGILALFVAGLAGVVSSVLTFLWPTLTGNTGGTYDVGAADDLRRRLEAGRRPYYEPSGGFYVVPYPAADLPAARVTYSGAVLAGMEAGWVALSQTCTHLGCRVPYCDTSGWFECPCHGSRFDGVGEQRRGPAPRGLDHYAVSVRRGRVVVDTRTLLHGPPTGTVTADSRPAGPHCG